VESVFGKLNLLQNAVSFANSQSQKMPL